MLFCVQFHRNPLDGLEGIGPTSFNGQIDFYIPIKSVSRDGFNTSGDRQTENKTTPIYRPELLAQSEDNM